MTETPRDVCCAVSCWCWNLPKRCAYVCVCVCEGMCVARLWGKKKRRRGKMDASIHPYTYSMQCELIDQPQLPGTWNGVGSPVPHPWSPVSPISPISPFPHFLVFFYNFFFIALGFSVLQIMYMCPLFFNFRCLVAMHACVGGYSFWFVFCEVSRYCTVHEGGKR